MLGEAARLASKARDNLDNCYIYFTGGWIAGQVRETFSGFRGRNNTFLTIGVVTSHKKAITRRRVVIIGGDRSILAGYSYDGKQRTHWCWFSSSIAPLLHDQRKIVWCMVTICGLSYRKEADGPMCIAGDLVPDAGPARMRGKSPAKVEEISQMLMGCRCACAEPTGNQSR